MKNEAMQDRFLTIVGHLLAEKFYPENLTSLIDAWQEKLAPYMTEQMKAQPGSSPRSLGSWKYEINAFKTVCEQRPKKVMNYLVSYFRLTDAEKQHYFGGFLARLGE